MKVAFLWHMHQPCYLDTQGELTMPWVFLHAIKDYYDMPTLAAEKKAHVTFNLTPSLISQLDLYTKEGIAKDRTLTLFLEQNPTQAQREWLIKLLKSPNYETMVRPIARYDALYHQNSYTEEEFAELKVAFLLAWCGRTLRQNNTLVAELLQKERYETADLPSLLEELVAFIPTILPLYKKLWQEGLIDLSTTPYHHPILPLLLDMEVAKEANPNTTLPSNPMRLEKDARLQLQKAIDLFEQHFGAKPKGMWPAEGAVSEEAAKLFSSFNLSWIATDEAILRKSGEQNHNIPYEFGGIRLFFRDHTLSDLIGFTYKNLPSSQVVQDFSKRLQEGLNFVILDGENAWEYYPNNGYDFLCELYDTLAPHTITFTQALQSAPKPLDRLAPGSWIYANFDTWVGDAQKNRAWELLYQTKRDALHHPKKSPSIEEHFLAAEASDWFWWYGSGHFTIFNEEFDSLFRSHLIAIYQELSLPVPANLLAPISSYYDSASFLSHPKNMIKPVLDGKVTSFFEWLGSGYLDERKGAAMQQVSQKITALYWGEDEEKLYIRLDGSELQKLTYKIFLNEEEAAFRFVTQEITEIAIEKEFAKKELDLRIEVYEKGSLVQILPSLTRLVIEIDRDYDKDWFV